MRETDNIIDVNAVIYSAVSLPLGRTPEERAERVVRALADAGCEIVPKLIQGGHYVLTPEGEDTIRDLVEGTALTQESVTAAGDALEREFDAAPSRFVRHVSGRDHAVDPRALAVRDLIEANSLIAGAVAVLGHEAADLIMQNLLTPGVGAAAAWWHPDSGDGVDPSPRPFASETRCPRSSRAACRPSLSGPAAPSTPPSRCPMPARPSMPT